MKENACRKGFKAISGAALILKILTIITMLAIIITVFVMGIKNNINNKEIEESQVVAEIEYTDDIKELTELDILKNTFGIKIYDENKANNNIISIVILITIECVVEFVLLILIFDGVQKLFVNLYKNDDGLMTNQNAKIVKNIGIFAILRMIIPLVSNIITRYSIASTIRGNISIIQIVFTLVIVLVSFITYYKIIKGISKEI